MGMHPFPRDTAHHLESTIKQYLEATLLWVHRYVWMVQIQEVKEVHTHAPGDFLASYTSFGMLMNSLM